MKHWKKNFFTALLFLFSFMVHASDFKFVVWGDSQFHNEQTFERVVRETELLKPALVLHVGDMIHGYTYDPEVARREWDYFREQIRPLTAPFYPTPGNHDVTTPEIEPVYGEIWGKDRYYYSFNHQDAHFIVLDVFYKGNFNTIVEEQMAWLKKDLEQNKNASHIFLSLHAPLHLDDKYDWKVVHNILRRYPVRAVFTGHSHIYDYRQKDGIDYFCLNSSGEMRIYSHLLGHSHHFLAVSVMGEKVHYAVIADEGIFPADAVPPGTYKRASRYLMDEQTILIPDPAKGPVETEVKIPLKNRTDETRSYTLSWQTRDYRWRFDPWGINCTLEPGEEKNFAFLAIGPRGKFFRDQLPRLEVSSPYSNKDGWETTLSYDYRLFSPPETRAKPLREDLKIDGRMDELVWNTVPAVTDFYVDTKGTTTTEKTIVKVLYDKDNLYLGIWGEEPNPAGLSAYAYGDVPLVFGDDDFEFFLDTNRDLKTFYRLMVNPKRVTLSSGPKGLYSFKFLVQVDVAEAGWSAEFKIPFEELKAPPPKEGDIWGFNIRRHRQQSRLSESDWSRMRRFPYQPAYFGLLRFD